MFVSSVSTGFLLPRFRLPVFVYFGCKSPSNFRSKYPKKPTKRKDSKLVLKEKYGFDV